jgi:flagellar assembly protein FliH
MYRIPLRIDEEVESLPLFSENIVEDLINVVDEEKEDFELIAEQHRKKLLNQAEDRLKQAAEVKLSAEQLIIEARRDAEQILAEARAKAQREGTEIALAAEKAAKEAGFAQGYQEGMTKAAAEGEEIRAVAQAVLEQSEETRRQTLAALEDNVTGLALEIAEKLVAAQLTLTPEAVCNIAKESLSLLENRLLVVLYINPAEMSLYESKMEELKAMLPVRAELQILSDAHVEPRGCRVETENGTVDATAETRRRAVLTALYGEDERAWKN